MNNNNNNNFNKFVNKFKPTEPYLPFCHTSDGDGFVDILEKSKLDIFHCPNFDQKLLYFFYGKPSYRPPAGEKFSSLPPNFPVAFAVRTDDLQQDIERIVPFDTGAFYKGKYSNHLPSKKECHDFFLTPALEVLGCMVSLFFNGNNDNYFLGNPIKSMGVPIQTKGNQKEPKQTVL